MENARKHFPLLKNFVPNLKKLLFAPFSYLFWTSARDAFLNSDGDME